jgi:hypothetical protein
VGLTAIQPASHSKFRVFRSYFMAAVPIFTC